MLIAQAADAATTGILGVVMQGGALVLLAFIVRAIVVILPKRLEKADELAAREADSRATVATELRKAVEAQAASYAASVDKILAANSEQARYERESCERGRAELLAQMLQTHEIVRETRHEVAGLAQARAFERAAAEAAQSKARHAPKQTGEPS